MTIPRLIDVAEINRRLTDLDHCVEDAPARTYEFSRTLREIIGRHCDELITELRAAGAPVCNGDGVRTVEAVIYGWVRDSLPVSELDAAEGFGRAMAASADTRARVLDHATRDRNFLEARAQ